ncbi:MAG: class II fructose-bisphosphate aldolase [bacterium]|mgnify:CR=1 FL=1|jgi:ketose-bisphosphate aldolase|nr:class II fructose-bisphosphate aldolase [Bacillota bacterium]
MSLVPMKELLEDARRNKYCIPAFDYSNYEMMRAVIEVAEEERSPVILMNLVVDMPNNGMEYLTAMAWEAADLATVPVVLHLDHCTDLDLMRRAIKAGYTSVMIDGSTLPFEENVELTRRVVAMARPRGISVEAELGHVGSAQEDDDASVLTQPEEVERFVEATDVDCLAVAVGTAHGVYKREPKLELDLLEAINKVSKVPLVLHGGSGTPDDQIKGAIERGVAKLNIHSELCVAMRKGLEEFLQEDKNPSPFAAHLFAKPLEYMREVVRTKIYLCGSQNKA